MGKIADVEFLAHVDLQKRDVAGSRLVGRLRPRDHGLMEQEKVGWVFLKAYLSPVNALGR